MFDLTAWLLGPETRTLEPGALVSALALELRRREVPVARLATSVLTKNPEALLQNLKWSVRSGVESHDRRHDIVRSEEYLGSPAEAVRSGAAHIRCRLDSSEPLKYRQLAELREEGLTDYAIFALAFGNGMRSYVSFSTDAAQGFGDDALASLEGLIPALTARLELASAELALRSLLDVYLGGNAAARVMAGGFRRGSGEFIRAAIWFCDLRNFTGFADSSPPEQVVAELDRYFETVAGPIAAQGGEILKFVGDAVMAIFPAGTDPGDACRRARSAAQEALARLAALPPRPGASEPPRIGIALHLGDVFYGNIGASDRLDFTVIGAAVNEACRVEALTKPLKTPLLLTASVAAHLPPHELVSLGTHPLKGVTVPLEVFTVKAG